MFKFSKASEARFIGVNPELVCVCKRALAISKVDFGIPHLGGYRTAEQQNALYEAGKSQLDGYHNESYHQTGNAIDVYAYVDGKASWEPEHLAMVAAAMLQAACEFGVKLEWGGLWHGFVDMPHFQIAED